MGNAGAGFIDWSLTVVGTVGAPVHINSIFWAASDCCYDLSIGTKDYDVTRSFDSMHTSRLQRIELPIGYTLSAESGEIVAYDGAFVYRAALVPEPSTYALFPVGLLALVAARRKQARPPLQQSRKR